MRVFKSEVLRNEAVVASFPAYDIVEREPNRDGYVVLSVEDLLGMDSGRGYYSSYYLGSAVSYALANGDCPVRSVERVKERGEALWWINARGSSLSAGSRAKEKLVLVWPGMRVRFEGRLFEIAKAPNSNLKLVELEG